MVGLIALLALISTSLGLAAGTGAGRSAAASAGTFVASGGCSKVEAIAAVKRLGLSDASPTYPVWKVVCGAFAGAGSQVMVASISGSENVGLIYWAVFRRTNGGWQLLMKQRQAAVLTAAGSDIKETVSIYRPGDPRCCPSGGERARLWHWNGSRFAASSWKQTTVHLDYFLSPSRNIWCGVGDEDIAYCQSKNRPHSAELRTDGKVTICNGPVCVDSRNFSPGVPVLAYGQTDEQGVFRCRSELTGVTCTVTRGKAVGKGFLINRAGVPSSRTMIPERPRGARRLWLGVAVVAVAVVVVATGASGGPGAGTITTFAGTDRSGFSGDGGPATRAQLHVPKGVAVDAKGSVYIADKGNDRVRIVSTNGKITTFAGSGMCCGGAGDGGPATKAILHWPDNVAVDAKGNVYIAEAIRVRKVSPNGIITTFAGRGRSGFSGDGGPATKAMLLSVSGLAVDTRGNVYIADSGNFRIRKVSPGGTITTFAGTGNWGSSGDGGPATSAQLDNTTGVAADGQGNVYIAGGPRVRKVSPGGKITTFVSWREVGEAGNGAFGQHFASGQHFEAHGVTVDGFGNVYITDIGNGYLFKVTLNGTITKVAGGRRCCTGDDGDGGPATDAHLDTPFGLAVDAKGSVIHRRTGWSCAQDLGRRRWQHTRSAHSPTPPKAKAPPTRNCSKDYCVPARAPAPTPADWNWNAHVPADSPVQGDEPLNVIISAASDVPLDKLLDALGDDPNSPWVRVSPGSLLKGGCLSVETANVDGKGQRGQKDQWRVGEPLPYIGCLDANWRADAGTENHARFWPQRMVGLKGVAWFATASFETTCYAPPDKKPVPVRALHYALDLRHVWHCVNGGAGSLHSDGYDLGASSFTHDICRAAKRRGWRAAFRKDSRPSATGQGGARGQGGAPYSGRVWVVTVKTTVLAGAARCA